MRGRPRVRVASLAAVVGLVLCATVAAGSWLMGPVEWNDSDSLFYEAQRLELLGRTAHEARFEVFSSDKAQSVAVNEDDADPPHVLNPTWVEYSAQFYRRRWTVPLIGAWLDPALGEHSLEVASFLGYLALGPSLFLLLVRRYSRRTSFLVAAFCLILPPVYKWSTFMGVDSWGLVFEVLAFVGLLCVAERGLRWLPLWIGAMLALSFTRDAAIALLLGVCWIAWRQRRSRPSRARNALLFLTGIAAALPAVLLFRASLRDQLAYVIGNYYVPTDPSWSYVLRGYPGQIRATMVRDLGYPLDFPLVAAVPIYVGMAALVALVVVFLLRAPHVPYFDVHRGAVIGYAVFLAFAANPQGYRLELVALPTLAVALAWGADVGPNWLRTRRPRTGVAVTAPS